MELTRERIDNLPAGREMDMLIAEHIWGWGWWTCPDAHFDKLNAPNAGAWAPKLGWTRVEYPSKSVNSSCDHYSTDISAAWTIIEKLENHPNEILSQITRKGWNHENLLWHVWFRECHGVQHDWCAADKSLPLAVCRAALLAVLEIEQRKNG